MRGYPSSSLYNKVVVFKFLINVYVKKLLISTHFGVQMYV